ncbi:hypothetical protein D3H65_14465 [Paraflavitalea soli]|uniref:Uncharacterized protein n=1 Tax=Paraflavitalea soli TaxID=2315862 RepID=A0A3B7MPZ0_9BACT|nr:hypothetical protein D3H65_14465 [Paraflavitalea soli]
MQPPFEAVQEVMVTLIAMIKATIVKIRFIFVVFRFENKPDEWEIQGIKKRGSSGNSEERIRLLQRRG